MVPYTALTSKHLACFQACEITCGITFYIDTFASIVAGKPATVVAMAAHLIYCSNAQLTRIRLFL